jgi:hypothetical protein
MLLPRSKLFLVPVRCARLNSNITAAWKTIGAGACRSSSNDMFGPDTLPEYLLPVLDRLARVLNQRRISYAVIGGLGLAAREHSAA